jgi:hypothetical protein
MVLERLVVGPKGPPRVVSVLVGGGRSTREECPVAAVRKPRFETGRRRNGPRRLDAFRTLGLAQM